MSASHDIRERAERLRQQLPPRRAATPPPENGRRLGTVNRSPTEELRVNWSEFEGRPFVSLRWWKRGDDGGWWPDSKRGLSVRIRELPDLAAAIAEALDLAEENQRRWQGQQGNRATPRMPGRGFEPQKTPPPSADFDEFSDGGHDGH
jgi:hypothetical protein